MNERSNIGPKIFYSKSLIPKGIKIIDQYISILKELYFIENPSFSKRDPNNQNLANQFARNSKIKSVYVFFPWNKIAVRIPEEKIYFKLRTARNRNLITESEQKNYRNSTVGIAGLSVGSWALSSLVLTGGSQKIKIADFDTLELTNLNRINASLINLGSNKADIASQRAWELDPFLKLDLFDKGIDNSNLEKFILKPKLNVFVDAMDNFEMKLKARLLCKKHRIPVLMATDNGDGVILDIERFDQEPNRKLFHGLIRNLEKIDLTKLSPKEWLRLAATIIGPDLHPIPLQKSLMELGKSIAGVPQLGTAASLAGTILAFAIRRISNNQPLKSGKYTMSKEAMLIPNYMGAKEITLRNKSSKIFTNFLNK